MTIKHKELLAAAYNETFLKPTQWSQPTFTSLTKRGFLLEAYGTDQYGHNLFFITDDGRQALFTAKLKPDTEKKQDIELVFEHHWMLLGGNARYKLEPQVEGLIPGRNFRPDFIHRASLTAIECQGMFGANNSPGAHRSVAGYMKDCKRMAIFSKYGWGMIYLTSIEINNDPQYCVDIVLEVIEQRIKDHDRMDAR